MYRKGLFSAPRLLLDHSSEQPRHLTAYLVFQCQATNCPSQCDLHMPNKDGYQACKEIRRWEKKNKYPHLPIIALSANVLGDVYAKCVEAGFNSYVTKPVEFKELSLVLTKFLDPEDPSKPHKFMRPRVKS